MKDVNYAYCVARLRANEKNMLDKAYLLKLCHSGSFENAVDMLVREGWINEKGSIKDITDIQYKYLWTLLNESVPDKKELEVLCVLNDFFNIKTAVKCSLVSLNPYDYYIYPSTLDLDELTEKIRNHSFSFLKSNIGEVAEKAYKMACLTENGQSAEIIIDKYAIDCLCEYSNSKKKDIINEICAFLCDTANIKIALRTNAMGKNSDFAHEAIGDCSAIDRKELIDKSLSSYEELKEYLLKTPYSEGVLLYEKSGALYDKWCDDSIIKIASNAKYTAFGFDPVCAFYYRKVNEIKSVRIILGGLQNGLDAQVMEERIRLLYA